MLGERLRIAALGILILAVITAACYLIPQGTPLELREDLTPLAREVILRAFTQDPLNSSLTPAIVSGVLWDFRGLDTIFETAVLFTATLGVIGMYYTQYFTKSHQDISRGSSPIAKTVAKVAVIVALTAAASITLHGHVTPGGGFQGGAIVSLTAFIYVVVYGFSNFSKFVTPLKTLATRVASLTLICFLALLPLTMKFALGTEGYVLQNQPKEGAPFGFTHPLNSWEVSLNVLVLNLIEFIAVGATFAALLTVLMKFGIRGSRRA